ncbi:MAG: hypothetical protein A2Y60_07545 [Chloroflexi bacterium RBG_13_54_9]|nr:MAG: hypothetical protein A2Y60_07545 [Chloroflexi bacterium RBG_13_54_9]
METNALIYSGIAGAATFSGILAVLWRQKLALKYSHYVNSFAAGSLLTLALAKLIPEASGLTSSTTLVVLASFIAFFLLEAVVVSHSGLEIHFQEGPRRAALAKGPLIFSGLFLHSLVDGFVIAVGFAVSFELGLLAAGAVILHELPEGITTFALLLIRMARKTALILSVAVALATPVGAALAMGPLGSLSESGLGVMLAIGAGSFLYVAASDLIPETHQGDIPRNVVAVLLGAVLMYLTVILLD